MGSSKAKLLAWLLVLMTALTLPFSTDAGILYPRESETREVKPLDGIWQFRVAPISDPDVGFREKWYSKRLAETGEVVPMPVPSSYNDVTQERSIRDHVGWVWYDREFYIPSSWNSSSNPTRIFLRFGSANYFSSLYVNGLHCLNHVGGFLPFQADITDMVKGGANFLTLALNNTLTPYTLPQGKITFHNDTGRYPEGYFEQTFNFDFFNYAGIHRPVYLHTTPFTYIDDITVQTRIDPKNSYGFVDYDVSVMSGTKEIKRKRLGAAGLTCRAELTTKITKTIVAAADGCKGTLFSNNVNFWWPGRPYLYDLTVKLHDGVEFIDVYRLNVGIRQITYDGNTININYSPFYFRGFGRHEDAMLRGRGVDYTTIVKDFNLLKWIGANSFRTSHYPYAEEIMDQADEQGIVIIDEAPAPALDGFDDTLLQLHKKTITELIQRDKNRPSVIMWSVSNEPQSQKPAAENYFKEVINHTRTLDPSRLVTVVNSQSLSGDKSAQFVDVICVNRYFGWYHDTGHTELITNQTVTEFTEWYNAYKKPVMITEYGAGTIAGLHADPPFLWTEDYQMDLMEQNFKAFDALRAKGFFVGEMIWNFADFATPQDTTRALYNRKGVFTRDRQPKAGARILRQRYRTLGSDDLSNALHP